MCFFNLNPLKKKTKQNTRSSSFSYYVIFETCGFPSFSPTAETPSTFNTSFVRDSFALSIDDDVGLPCQKTPKSI